MGKEQEATHEFKGFDNYVAIVRTGNHVAMNGEKVSFSEADLDSMVLNTPPNTAPIVIGHPRVNAPAFGWGVDYKRDGNMLFAKFDQVNPAFAKWVESGAYKKRSVSVVKSGDGWKIKHVGYLGANPPAIDGLPDMEFAGSEEGVDFEFSDVSAFSEVGYHIQTIGGLFRAMRDKMIESDGVEAADRFFSEWQVSQLQNAHENIMSRISQNNSMDSPSNFSEADFESAFADHMVESARAVLADEAQAAADLAAAQAAQAQAEAQFSAQIAALSTDKAKLESQLARQRLEAQKAAWQAAGILSPAKSVGIVDFMAAIAANETFEFSEGGAEKAISPSEYFAAFVGSLKPIQIGIEQAAGALQSKPNDAKSIEFAAKAYQKGQSEQGINVSWTDACIHVAAGHDN